MAPLEEPTHIVSLGKAELFEREAAEAARGWGEPTRAAVLTEVADST